ncbi:MAG: energy-coupling factor transporter ATPase [Clostridia bacterium]|nr:energy-coupling factor transporter ATPase [Clostridia bacterium]
MIKVTGLTYIYQQGMPFEKKAVDNVSFEIPTGDFLAIIGHTGSGKSTLIQHFNALLKPTQGKIEIDGIDVTDPKTNLMEIRKNVGLVFQYPEHQLFEETVYKDIAFGPKNMGFSESEIDERVVKSALAVGLTEELLQKSPFELSGGQKRRAAIAGVLSMSPKVIILDEPTAGLDPKGRDEILGELSMLHKQNPDMTILFVSHSMEDVAKLAEHVLVMDHGHIAMHGSTSEVFEKSYELKKIGLDVPQITELTHRLIKDGIDIRPDIYTVKFASEIYKNLIKEADNV